MHKKTKTIAFLSLFIAIEILFSVTPLGFIPLGFINATTLHIPVIVAGIILGKKEGMIVGFVFGLLSLLKATFSPNLTSFVFTPFYSIGDLHGNVFSLLIVFIPRIFMGFISGAATERICAKDITHVKIGLIAFGSSLVNTVLVIGSIFIFFGQAYAQALGMEYTSLLAFLMSLIGINGMLEALLATLVCVPICMANKLYIKERLS